MRRKNYANIQNHPFKTGEIFLYIAAVMTESKNPLHKLNGVIRVSTIENLSESDKFGAYKGSSKNIFAKTAAALIKTVPSKRAINAVFLVLCALYTSPAVSTKTPFTIKFAASPTKAVVVTKQ